MFTLVDVDSESIAPMGRASLHPFDEIYLFNMPYTCCEFIGLKNIRHVSSQTISQLNISTNKSDIVK